MLFLDHLFNNGIIDADVHKKANEKVDIINYLYKSNIISKSILVEQIQEFYKVEYIDLNKIIVEKDFSDIIPESLMIKYNLFFFDREGDIMKVVTAIPNDFVLDEDLGIALYPLKCKKYFAFDDEITKKKEEKAIIEEDVKEQESTSVVDNKSTVELPTQSGDVVRIVNDIIKEAIDKNSSDIHIEPLENEVRVRYRIDGELYIRKEGITTKDYPNVVSRIKVMSELDPTEKRKSQDGKISNYSHKNTTYDIRVSSMSTIHGEKIVMRIMSKTTSKHDFGVLGFTQKEAEKINKLLEKQSGIFIITGETGSGKSTTLYTMLHKLNSPNINICTIEDPVESSIEGVTQVQLNELAGITFANTLRTFLRQDPDIIMIGEIRDLETADIAIKASNTGHYVLSTLHTNNTIATINRLISMGVEPYKISENIVGIMSQKLVKKLCPHCKIPHVLTSEEKAFITEIETRYNIQLLDGTETFYEAIGCSECTKGYRGRMVIAEILEVNEVMNEMISNNANSADLRKVAIENQSIFIPFEISGIEKAKRGEVALSAIMKIFK